MFTSQQFHVPGSLSSGGDGEGGERLRAAPLSNCWFLSSIGGTVNNDGNVEHVSPPAHLSLQLSR